MRILAIDDSLLRFAREREGLEVVDNPHRFMPEDQYTRDEAHTQAVMRGSVRTKKDAILLEKFTQVTGYAHPKAFLKAIYNAPPSWKRVLKEQLRGDIESGDIDAWFSAAQAMNERIKTVLYSSEFPDTYKIDATLPGGRRELFVAGEPKLPLNGNHIYRNPDRDHMLKSTFDEDRLVDIIEKFDPDILLLDINFCAPVPNKTEALFQRNLEELEPYRFVAGTEGKLAYKPYFGDNQSYPRMSAADYAGAELGSVEKSLHEHGGAVVGRALADRGIPFSFWTAEYGHAYEGLADAYTLGLLYEEDILEATRARSPFVTPSRSLLIGGKNRIGTPEWAEEFEELMHAAF